MDENLPWSQTINNYWCKMELAECDFDLAYNAGKTSVNADALSRNPFNLEDI